MGYSYPFTITTMDSTGDRPSNGKAVRPTHFNRIFKEVNAVESAVGVNPQGSQADLKTRLTQYMNDDGTYKKELICEDDPSGNQRGTARYVNMVAWAGNTVKRSLVQLGATTVFLATTMIPMPYTAFDDPPVVLWSVRNASFQTSFERMQVLAAQPFVATIECRGHANALIGATTTMDFVVVAISQFLKTFEEDVAWCLPPARTGG